MTQTHVFRFFGHKNASGDWEFAENDLHQALHVLRLDVGDMFEITDFEGTLANCRVVSKQKQKLNFDVVHEKKVEDLSGGDLPTLVLAQSKPGYFLDALPVLNELGFAKVVIFFQRTFPSKQKDSFREKIRKGIIESSKQCKRDFLLDVQIFDSVQDCMESSFFDSRQGWVLLPESENQTEAMKNSILKNGGFVLIGSELGFEIEEINYLRSRSNIRFTKMGSLVLRSFTATLVAASYLFLDKTK